MRKIKFNTQLAREEAIMRNAKVQNKLTINVINTGLSMKSMMSSFMLQEEGAFNNRTVTLVIFEDDWIESNAFEKCTSW